jgi:hypothetical protein
MEKFWNIIHFFVNAFLNKANMALDKISPFTLILKIPAIENLIIKRGGSIEMINNAASNVTTNPILSVNSWYASLVMIAMPFMFFFGFHNFYFLIFNDRRIPSFEIYIYPLLIYGVISGFINYFLLFRHDKYIKYFKKFEKLSREWKVKWAWISAGVILFPFLVLISSFIAMSK